MATKIFFVFCTQALLIKAVFSQCIGRDNYYGLGSFGLINSGLPSSFCSMTPTPIDISATSGGNFHVTSSSGIPPSGLSIASENIYEGGIAVVGKLPFEGTVILEGVLPSGGVGAVSYGCGNGNTNMVTETHSTALSPAALTAPIMGYTPAAGIAPTANFAFPASYATSGCEYGRF